MQNINKYILEKAKEAGICEPWAEMVAGTSNIDDLLKMYVKGIDFCIEKNFPSNEDLLSLGGAYLVKHGIYIDAAIDCPVGEFLVLLGRCTGILNIAGYSTTQIFIKHTSCITVHVKNNSFVVIDCFDNAKLDLVADGNSKVLVNVYGSACITKASEGTAQVKVIHKNQPTY